MYKYHRQENHQNLTYAQALFSRGRITIVYDLFEIAQILRIVDYFQHIKTIVQRFLILCIGISTIRVLQ